MILGGVLPKPNIKCDPVQAPFYVNNFDLVTSLRRATHRLYSLQGVTNLLECDSFLRRFYVYSNHGHVLPAVWWHPMNSRVCGYVSHVVLLCAMWEFLAYFGHYTMFLPGKVAMPRKALI